MTTTMTCMTICMTVVLFSIQRDAAYMNEDSLLSRTDGVGTIWKSNDSKHGSNKTDEKEKEQSSQNVLHRSTHKHKPNLQHSIRFHD